LNGVDLDAPSSGAPAIQVDHCKQLSASGCSLHGEAKVFVGSRGTDASEIHLADNACGTAAPLVLQPADVGKP